MVVVRHFVEPTLDVSMFMGKNYIMVQLNPAPHPAMMQPVRYHATISRGKWSRHVNWNAATAELAERMQKVFDAAGFPTFIRFERAPWKNSWNFGFDNEWSRKLSMIRECGDVIMIDIDPHCKIQEHRELHCSWV